MNKKKKSNDYTSEEYWIIYNEYHKDTDTWEISKKEEGVYVHVPYSDSIKNNHDKARKIFCNMMIEQGRVVEVKTVIYV